MIYINPTRLYIKIFIILISTSLMTGTYWMHNIHNSLQKIQVHKVKFVMISPKVREKNIIIHTRRRNPSPLPKHNSKSLKNCVVLPSSCFKSNYSPTSPVRTLRPKLENIFSRAPAILGVLFSANLTSILTHWLTFQCIHTRHSRNAAQGIHFSFPLSCIRMWWLHAEEISRFVATIGFFVLVLFAIAMESKTKYKVLKRGKKMYRKEHVRYSGASF